MVTLRDVVPVLAGVGDGLADAGINYIDEATGKTAEPVFKRPSTYVHLGIGAVLGTLSILGIFKGDAKLITAVIGGRHLGTVGATAVSEKAKGAPLLGSKATLEVVEGGGFPTLEGLGTEMEVATEEAGGTATTGEIALSV